MTEGYEQALVVLRTLRAHGFPAYLVGGCVRDRLAARPVKDYDIATAALPEQVMKLFARTVPTGLQHGTVTVLMDQIHLEVTTFRIEGSYVNHRRPETVEFVSDLVEDLQRRDFTMNAMACDEQGVLFDPFGGQRDLEAGILRAVGQAEQRFAEDALRMVRCIRFAAEYELTPERLTWQALLEGRTLLRHIAMERIREEWDRMLRGRHPARATRLLIDSELLLHLKEPLPIRPEKWLALGNSHLPDQLGALAADERWPRWTLLLEAVCESDEQIKETLANLRFSGQDRAQITACFRIGLHLFGKDWKEDAADDTPAWLLWKKRWQKAILAEGRQAAQRWLKMHQMVPDLSALAAAWLCWSEEGMSLILQHGQQWEDDMEAAAIGELAISGKALQQLGMSTGPLIGRTLQALLEAVVWQGLPNDSENLREQVRKWQLIKEAGQEED